MARLYADENFPFPVVAELRKLGHDVLTSHEAGQANLAVRDEEVVKFAESAKRTILTLNRKHFVALHHAGLRHSGIVVCTFDLDFAGQARRIDQVIGQSDLCGRLVRVNRPPGH